MVKPPAWLRRLFASGGEKYLSRAADAQDFEVRVHALEHQRDLPLSSVTEEAFGERPAGVESPRRKSQLRQ